MPWDVVCVPFPFTEGEGDKRRPALVVSSEGLSEAHGLYWLVMITSAKNSAWAGDVPIADHEAVGLPAPSVIRPAKIATLQRDKILRTLGRLPDPLRVAVGGSLRGFWA